MITLTTERAQPCALCLYVSCRLDFLPNSILNELKLGNPGVEHGLFWKVWPLYVKLFCPLLIALTFAQGL